ncbi:MAG TPA: hypothetical protein PKH02_06345 [Bacteroidales bacterium]|nr:hypothetical protein [Bacteroidales bacterium]
MKSSPATSQVSNEVSVYEGEKISNDSIVRYCYKIRSAFPSLPPEFYDVLLEMVKEENFTDQRFRDAVHYVIKTCKYPTPTIASFISYDRKYKVYSYNDILKKADELGSQAWGCYQAVQLPDRKYVVWVDKNDISQYNLEKYIVLK